jgi:hypothetical protein
VWSAMRPACPVLPLDNAERYVAFTLSSITIS